MTVDVHASRDYPVHIAPGLLTTLGRQVADLCPDAGKAVIVSDSHVWPLYGRQASQSLAQEGLVVLSYIFPAGEASKNSQTYLDLLNFLARERVTRWDVLIALGGGVVGDLTGFAAGTYQRGMAYIQVPTTVLAAVDSSVGGKTAIDLPAGKNLAGIFWHPRLVLCDTDTLDTLPREVFRDGCAEIVKYAILYDPELFSHLAQSGLDFHREGVIHRCVELKRDVVALDEFDTGLRQKLNLGHTLGHGIEALSDYRISHGSAVAMGLATIARGAQAMGLCDRETTHRILTILDRFGLPSHAPCRAQALYQAALSDKKRNSQGITLVIPQAIGSSILRPSSLEELFTLIQAGL